MCSTIRPLPPRHCFGLFQKNHVWKAPTSTFHQNLELPGMLQPVSRSKGRKCARLSAPSLCPTVLVCFKGPMYGKPQAVPFTEPWIATIAPTSFEIQGSKVCSTIRPLPLRHCFGLFQRNHVWKAPSSTFHQNLELPGLPQPVLRSKGRKCARLSAPSLCATVLVCFKGPMYGKPQAVPFTEPWIATIVPTSFEIQGSKVCSTIRPLPLRHCFGLFQGKHVWKAPTSTLHQNLELPGLPQPVSRSKGRKCARLSAPSLCATVLVCFKGTMYGKPQAVPFTRTLNCQDCPNQF